MSRIYGLGSDLARLSRFVRLMKSPTNIQFLHKALHRNELRYVAKLARFTDTTVLLPKISPSINNKNTTTTNTTTTTTISSSATSDSASSTDTANTTNTDIIDNSSISDPSSSSSSNNNNNNNNSNNNNNKDYSDVSTVLRSLKDDDIEHIARFVAGRWAAKEALVKASGIRFLYPGVYILSQAYQAILYPTTINPPLNPSPNHYPIVNEGKPYVYIDQQLKEMFHARNIYPDKGHLHLSLSHDGDFVQATALLETIDDNNNNNNNNKKKKKKNNNTNKNNNNNTTTTTTTNNNKQENETDKQKKKKKNNNNEKKETEKKETTEEKKTETKEGGVNTDNASRKEKKTKWYRNKNKKTTKNEELKKENETINNASNVSTIENQTSNTIWTNEIIQEKKE